MDSEKPNESNEINKNFIYESTTIQFSQGENSIQTSSTSNPTSTFQHVESDLRSDNHASLELQMNRNFEHQTLSDTASTSVISENCSNNPQIIESTIEDQQQQNQPALALNINENTNQNEIETNIESTIDQTITNKVFLCKNSIESK
jgi:hypothetical protein